MENGECEGGRMMEMEGGKDGDVEGGKDAKLGEQRSGSIPERFWSAGCSLCKVNTWENIGELQCEPLLAPTRMAVLRLPEGYGYDGWSAYRWDYQSLSLSWRPIKPVRPSSPRKEYTTTDSIGEGLPHLSHEAFSNPRSRGEHESWQT